MEGQSCKWCSKEGPGDSAGGLRALLRACRRFTFDFVEGPESVGMATGATIHTANGLKVRVQRRDVGVTPAGAESQEVAVPV